MRTGMGFGRFLVVTGLALCASLPAAAGNLVVNGSFESPALGFGSYGVFGSIPGWTTTVGSGIEVENNAVGPAFAGNQLVEMDSNDNSGMQQVIATQQGQVYAFSFEYSPRPGVPASSSGIEVRVNGNVIDTIAIDGTGLPSTAWTRFAYSVTATGGTTTIEFRAVGTSDGVGGFLDDVRFDASSAAAVPTLAQWALAALSMFLAAAGIGWTRARPAC